MTRLLLAVALLAAPLAALAQTCNVTNVVSYNKTTHKYTVDPWIVPSTNTTNGSLPPGVCPFSSYPAINATCKDTILFITRAIPAGLRAHGVYLLEDDFVRTDGTYHCPSPATDIDLRNATDGNIGRCRGNGMYSVLIDGTSNFTANFTASSQCSGYKTIDQLEVFLTVPKGSSCNTATVKTKKCKTVDRATVKIKDYVAKGKSKTLVFSCPNISGNQPGKLDTHCDDKMVLVVHAKC